VCRRPKQRWYNRTKSDFINVTRLRLLDRTRSIVTRAMKEQTEGQ
jgi:hypothetical protein